MPGTLVNKHVEEEQRKNPDMVWHAAYISQDGKEYELVDGRIFMTRYADMRLVGHPSLPIEFSTEDAPAAVVKALKNGRLMVSNDLVPPDLPVSSRLRSGTKRGLAAVWHEPLPPRGTKYIDGFLEYQTDPVKTLTAYPVSRPYSDFMEPLQVIRKRGRTDPPPAPPSSPEYHSSDHESPYEASSQSDSSDSSEDDDPLPGAMPLSL